MIFFIVLLVVTAIGFGIAWFINSTRSMDSESGESSHEEDL